MLLPYLPLRIPLRCPESGFVDIQKLGDGHSDFGIAGFEHAAAARTKDVPRHLEKAEPGAKYHAVAEEGVSMRDIAEAIGRRLKLPVKSIDPKEAESYFGWLAMFAAHDMPASSEQTRKKLGWLPTGPGLIADLEQLRVTES